MRSGHYDDWTIETWRIGGSPEPERAARPSDPPFWKDLTVALIVALLVWAMAGVLLW